jgi:hypothetical protein
MRYEWRDGGRFAVKAQVAGERLAELTEANGGHVTPEVVVDDARPDEAALHPCFVWDDYEAAEKYREEQARSLIRSVRVVIDEDRPASLNYVSVRLSDIGPAYVTTARAMSDDELRDQAIGDAIGGLNAWQRRYEHLAELRPVFQAVAKAVARVEKQRKRQAPPAIQPTA